MPEAIEDLLIGPSLLKKIERLELVSRRLYHGSQSGARKSRSRGSGMEFADHRDYSPGDDFRTIDWNVYARLDNLTVKIFETEQNLSVSILVDTSASMGFGGPSKLHFAASVAAALAYLSLVNEDATTICGISDSIRDMVSSATQSLSPAQIFEFCAGLSPAGETHLDETIKSFAFHSQRPGLLFVLSDFLTPGRLEDTLQPLVYAGYDICGLQILAAEELNPDLAGEMDIVDSETGDTVPLTVRGDTRARYQDSLEQFLRRTEQALKTSYANYLHVTNERPIEQVIMYDLRGVGIVRE